MPTIGAELIHEMLRDLDRRIEDRTRPPDWWAHAPEEAQKLWMNCRQRAVLPLRMERHRIVEKLSDFEAAKSMPPLRLLVS